LGLNLGGTDYPWTSWQIIGLLLLAVVAAVLFIATERRAAEPILSLALFKSRVFTVTNIVGFLMGLGMFGSLMFLPLFLQGVIGVSATSSGNTMLPMMLAMIGASILGGQLITKVSFRSLFVSGMSLMAIGFYLLSTMTVHTSQLMAIVYIILIGLGMGLIMPTVTIAVQSAFPPRQRGVATSATQFFRSIGGTLGMTVLGVVFNYRSLTLMEQEFFPAIQNNPDLQTGPLSSMLVTAHTHPQSLFNVLLSPDMVQQIPAELQQILLPPLKVTLADSLQMVFFVAMGITIVGIAISFFMGNTGIEKKNNLPAVEQAGVTLFAEGFVTETEIAAELVPDLFEEKQDQFKQK
jgi:MFS family permease